MSQPKAVIFGCKGPHLLTEEFEFFAEIRPVGFILFSRNCNNPDQLRNLISNLRRSINKDNAPILIDQEGGRVVRLGPPYWRLPPSAKVFADLAINDIDLACEALNLNIRLIGEELREVGINVNCLPVLDTLFDDADAIISDRSYGCNSQIISTLGRVACNSLLNEGVLPILKHIPGHGRANVDSHHALPIVQTEWHVLSKVDFLPFRLLADMPIAMTAHIIYRAIDEKYPATISRKIIKEIIRKEIGFDGLLISDDLSMKALHGDLSFRVRAALEAGCDLILHCNGDMYEMKTIGGVVTDISEKTRDRVDRALNMIKGYENFDKRAAIKRLGDLGVN